MPFIFLTPGLLFSLFFKKRACSKKYCMQS